MVEHALSKPCPRGQSHEGACKLLELPKRVRTPQWVIGRVFPSSASNNLTWTTAGTNLAIDTWRGIDWGRVNQTGSAT